MLLILVTFFLVVGRYLKEKIDFGLSLDLSVKKFFQVSRFFFKRMILMNYLNEVGDCESSGLVGVMAISTPWNCMESCESLEQPINSFLFNQHLTRNLVQMIQRYSTTDTLKSFIF